LIDEGILDEKWFSSFISTEEESITETPIPILTTEQQAEKTVRDYFEFISENKLDEAYDLLDSNLQKHTDFIRGNLVYKKH